MSNPHYEALNRNGYTVEDPHDAAIAQTEAQLAVAYELRTQNLLATYNTPNLYDTMQPAEAQHLERTILQRQGLRDV